MKKLVFYCALIFLVTSCGNNVPNELVGRWTAERAHEWYASREWPVGINYVTSTAINQFEMWQEETFDPETIDRELGWAEDLGFNTVRIFLHDMVWEADPDGFKNRLNDFLTICEKHGMQALVTFFTNGGNYNSPKLGKQPESVQGVHNSGWIQSPGAERVNNLAEWPKLEKYVKDILTTFRDDKRILLWHLYNEPESPKHGANSLPLLREAFKWGRSVNPSQPLSSPIWIIPGKPKTSLDIVSFLGENCDVMTFHCYYEPEEMEAFIKLLKPFDRPMICTEYMGRPRSTFEEILPILKRENVGAISWGLVAGKCNFHLQWSSKAGDPVPEVWFHDIFSVDGTPHNPDEIKLIKELTGKN